MGVVACKEEIYDAIVDNAPKGSINYFMVILIQEFQYQLRLH